MDWIFWAIAGASVVHVVEEYAFPGGFHRWMNDRLRRRGSSARLTPALAVRLNAGFAVPPLALVLAR